MNEFKVVTVRKDDLEAYMKEYHHARRPMFEGGNTICKADGQEWPCDIYKRLRAALNGEPTP
jgi:hypothetical protein